MGQKSRIDAVHANANDIVLDKAGGIKNVMSAIGKTPVPLGTDHSPMFTRFSSPIATPYDGLLPTVFSPPPAAPSRWGLDETGAQAYHDLLLRWSHDELLMELSTSRHTFVQARADLYPLAQRQLRHWSSTTPMMDNKSTGRQSEPHDPCDIHVDTLWNKNVSFSLTSN